MKKRTKRLDISILMPSLITMVGIIIIFSVLSGFFTSRLAESEFRNTLSLTSSVRASEVETFLKEQSSIVHTMKTHISSMKTEKPKNKKAVMNYLARNLSENENALMYYYCEGRDGAVYPADQSKLDLDPTTRTWWTDAFQNNSLIYTAPYMDFATGQMIVSIAEPISTEGDGSCILADISIDTIVSMINDASSENISVFLLDSTGDVVAHENDAFLPTEEGNTNLVETFNIDLSSTDIFTFTDYDGSSKYCCLSTIGGTGWIVGVTENTSILTTTLLSCLLPNIIAAIVLLVVGCIFTFRKIKLSLRPIKVVCDFIVEKIVGEFDRVTNEFYNMFPFDKIAKEFPSSQVAG